MENPYASPKGALVQKAQPAPWTQPPSLQTDLQSLGAWLRRSGLRLLALNAIVQLPATLLLDVGDHLFQGLPTIVGSVVSTLSTLITTAAVIRVALDDESGRSLSLGEALNFGVRNMGKLAMPVIGRQFAVLLASLLLVVPGLLLAARWMGLEAVILLNLPHPDETQQAVGTTPMKTTAAYSQDQLGTRIGTLLLLLLPMLVMATLEGGWAYFAISSELSLPLLLGLSLPLAVLRGTAASLIPLTGTARVLSTVHAKGMNTEPYWAVD